MIKKSVEVTITSTIFVPTSSGVSSSRSRLSLLPASPGTASFVSLLSSRMSCATLLKLPGDKRGSDGDKRDEIIDPLWSQADLGKAGVSYYQ